MDTLSSSHVRGTPTKSIIEVDRNVGDVGQMILALALWSELEI